MKKLQTQSMLVETTEYAFSSPSGRILRTEFKGMTPDQIKAIRELQERQKLEKEVSYFIAV